MVYVSSLAARVLNRLQLLPVFRIGYKLKILNRTFKIPIIENKEGFIYHLGVGEPYLLKVLRQLYAVKKFTFLDAGVNFGQTLLKVKAVHPDAPYIGFEPSGLCSYYTSHLIKVNNIHDAKLIRCGLSDTTGVLTLYAGSAGDTRATLLHGAFSAADSMYEELVPVVPLDSLTAIITKPGKDIILKVDVEGAEWMVFQGAKQFIRENNPVILFENLPFRDDEHNMQQQRTISGFLSENKYALYVIDEEKKALHKIAAINNRSEFGQTNYLAIPEAQEKLYPMLA